MINCTYRRESSVQISKGNKFSSNGIKSSHRFVWGVYMRFSGLDYLTCYGLILLFFFPLHPACIAPGSRVFLSIKIHSPKSNFTWYQQTRRATAWLFTVPIYNHYFILFFYSCRWRVRWHEWRSFPTCCRRSSDCVGGIYSHH